MVAICCFQCDPRLATYIISIISFLHFTVEVILLADLDTEHRLVSEDNGIKFYIVFTTHVFLLVASVFLFLAAFTLVRMLAIPWLLGIVLNLSLYIALLIVIILRVINGWSSVELEKGLFIVLTIFTLSYCLWIVIVFFLELGKQESHRRADDDDDHPHRSKVRRSIFTLYDNDDTETDADDEEKLSSRARRTNSKTNNYSNRKDDTEPLLKSSNGG